MKRDPSITIETVAELLTAIPETQWERCEAEAGTNRFVTGSPSEVAVEVTDDEVRVYLPEMAWTSPYEIEDVPELAGRINLESHGPSVNKEVFASALQHLVKAVRALRRMRFVACKFCGEETPPEYQFDERTCHGCASREYGVVF